MSASKFSEMAEREFDELIDGYIERTSKGYGEMPADIFLDLLGQRLEAQAEETLTLSIDVDDDGLVISPDRETTGVVIRGNEIVIGKHRLVLHLTS